MNQLAEYPDQRSISSKVIARTHKHTYTWLIALLWPMKLSVTIQRKSVWMDLRSRFNLSFCPCISIFC